MKTTRPLLATAAALLALNLGACSNEPETPPTENLSATDEDSPAIEAEPEPMPVASPTPIEEPTDVNAAAALDPEPVTTPDEQMLDDASATGMTARANRDQADNATAADGEIEQ